MENVSELSCLGATYKEHPFSHMVNCRLQQGALGSTEYGMTTSGRYMTAEVCAIGHPRSGKDGLLVYA